MLTLLYLMVGKIKSLNFDLITIFDFAGDICVCFANFKSLPKRFCLLFL